MEQHSTWLLTARQRGNPDTGIDRRRLSTADLAWTNGNEVVPLVHGRSYFAALARALATAGPGDLVMFTDWRGDPDEPLDDRGTRVSDALCAAAERGALVKGLIWRSHLDALRYTTTENRRLGAEIEQSGGECLLDMRVRPGGSHHQKMVVVRYRDHPQQDVAFVGGIDLCHSRRDDARHRGDAYRQAMPALYGPRPPWHDVQLAIRGPAVGDLEYSFRERWYDPGLLSRNPFRLVGSLLEHDDLTPDPLPPQWPDPLACGEQVVQVLRTYPYRRRPYPFATRGERSIARAYAKALRQCRRLIYLEDQYLWSLEVAEVFAAALRREPELLMIAVIPLLPDVEGITGRAEAIGRNQALELLREAGGDRVAVYGIENHADQPIYVHAKVCILDDVWSTIGSDNLNLRSWTHDSELTCAVMDDGAATSFGRRLRLQLNREHLDRIDGDDADLHDPAGLFIAYRKAAEALDAWHAQPRLGQQRLGERPPGRLRACPTVALTRWQQWYAQPIYHLICDPDGRPPELRRHGRF